MKKETWSVVFACALGAFMGALSALEIQSSFAYGSYFWGVGALFGGLVAYVSVDFRQFRAGVARSYRVSVDSVRNAFRSAADWHPHRLYWKARVLLALGMLVLFGSAWVFFCAAHFYWAKLDFTGISISLFSLFLGVVSALACFVSFLMLVPGWDSREEWAWRSSRVKGKCETYDEYLEERVEIGWLVIRLFNPVVMPFAALWVLGIFLRDVIKRLWRGRQSVAKALIFLGREAVRFAVRTFVFVHSERRTICFVDATIGAAAGFFLGSAILGAMIGAVLGVANYELVSVRWLKLVPARTK